MSNLQTRLSDLATRAAGEDKSLRTLLNGNVADLTALATTAKNNLVAAVNEVRATAQSASTAAALAAPINDAGSSTLVTWSASKIAQEIQNAKNALTNGAAAALDTLAEIATALGGDANFAATMTTALAKRLRYDAAQVLTVAEKTQACANLGIGEPDTDFVAVFNAGLI